MSRSATVPLYDAIDARGIPSGARFAAGYVDGRWPSYDAIRRRLGPRGVVLSITVTGSRVASIADVERGDLTIEDAARWLRFMRGKWKGRPGLYCSLDLAHQLVPQLAGDGLPRDVYALWLAHWTGRRHICGPGCGWPYEPPGATQWLSVAAYDVSETTAHWASARAAG